MKQLFVLLVCAISIVIYKSNGLNLIDVPKEYIRLDVRARIYGKYKIKPLRPLRTMKEIEARRQGLDMDKISNIKDNNLKDKIGTLIEQTITDTKRETEGVTETKIKYNTTAAYQIGFLMYMVKRSRDVMNELFTVAVNHKEDWKVLDQLKIFELIVHTNVDTSNLLRQLLEIATNETGKIPAKKHPEPAAALRFALL